MNRNDLFFRRKFSVNLYKNLKLRLASMDFFKDITGTLRGDPYPILFAAGEYAEKTRNGCYCFSGAGAELARYMCPLYPYAVNEVTLEKLNGACGFVFGHGKDRVRVLLYGANGLSVRFEAPGGVREVPLAREFAPGAKLSVQVRKNSFDVYCDFGGCAEYIDTFSADCFADSCAESFFREASVGVIFGGEVVCRGAEVYDDSGISQADIRPVCFENGDVVTENGKIFFTASIRLHEESCQGVFSWVPGTAEFALTGVLFFDAGDGFWENDVASCLVFDRSRKKWLLWVCAFSHGHILAHAEFDGEPRFGRNVIDIALVNRLPENADDTVFGGKQGDEDPALIYDETRRKWLLAVCRVSREGGYRYFFFESDKPFGGFECIGSGVKGSETGGSFVRYGGELFFACGNSFDLTADYRVYKIGSFNSPGKLVCDRGDGGFRGWGSVFTVKQGSRERVFWLTFDRRLGSAYNWSYGNIYCFEGFLTEK